MRIEHDLDLTPYNSYRLRSCAKTALFPETPRDYCALRDRLEREKLIVLAGGNNVILSRERYVEPIVVLNGNVSFWRVRGSHLFAGAGLRLAQLSELALDRELSGMEVFWDIPGTLGGAIYMNAGTAGESILDIVERVFFFDLVTGEIECIEREACGAGYRSSAFAKRQGCILSAELRLSQSTYDVVLAKMRKVREGRAARFPSEYPNAGSVFKRPANGLSVGEMMERLSLKGLRIGDAEISTKHGGFIVNRGAATRGDILRVIDVMAESARREFGVSLELEQRVL